MTRTIDTRTVMVVLSVLTMVGCSGASVGSSGPSVTFAPVPTASSATAGTGAGSGSAPMPAIAATTTTPATPTPATPATPAPGTASATTPTSDGGTATTSPGGTPDPTSVAPVVAAPGPTPTAVIVDFAKVDLPVGISSRPGDERMFVATQDGTVVPVAPDGTVGAPVLDVTALTDDDGERGLLGLAFHPTDPLAYIDYTAADTGNTHIEEFTVAADGTFDAASRRAVLEIEQPYANHNGGQLAFGPDGDLYIGMGDGGAGGDPQRRALDAADLLGKILRIDPRATGDQPYTVPADNPFVGVSGAKPEIWSVGLRNPFRFSFDPATNDLWIADVGQNAWEEIDVAWAADGGGRGANFGWSAFEGNHRYNDEQPTTAAIPPIHEYAHGDAGCSISGGARYRGNVIPSLQGWYVYADYCSGQVRALQIVDRAAGAEVLLGTPGAVSSVSVGPDGELYVTSVGNNAIGKIVAA
ncbi:MAG: hypothetical protein JWM12_3688 [Ilumatobacteraceae bacterium]|nr:hypothetical protein [Ilumatobacteraceae bacterium]